jgi:hypothetical protein
VIVYLPAELADRFRDHAGQDDTSYGAWFLDRFDELYDALADVYEPATQRRSPLPPRQRESRRRVVTPTQLQLRLTTEELEVVDKRAAELGAPSRSEFVTTVIDLAMRQQSGDDIRGSG